MTAPTPVLHVPAQRAPDRPPQRGWTAPPEVRPDLPHRLADVVAKIAALESGEAQLLAAVGRARASGATWTVLGQVFGLTPKSVWKRYAAALREVP